MNKLTQYEKDIGWCEEGNTYCSVAEERYKMGEADMLRTIKKGIEKILRQYESDKVNVPKPDALSIYAYLVVLEDQL